MGSKCCSCCRPRPRYKQQVRGAVFEDKIEPLAQYAARTNKHLGQIGRYLKKQIDRNLTNDRVCRNTMEAYNAIMKHCDNKVLLAIDDYVVDCCNILLEEGFKHNNVNYLMYAMETLKYLLHTLSNRFFPFQRLSDIFDLLIKIARSEHMESDYYGFLSPTPSQFGYKSSTNTKNSGERSFGQLKRNSNNNAVDNSLLYNEKTIIYHALDTLKLAVENCSKDMINSKFSELMSLFVYNLRPTLAGNSGNNSTNLGLNDNNKTSGDIEQIATTGFELLCMNIAGYNNNKLEFTLEQIEQDIRRYDTQFVLSLLKTISKKSRVNAIDIAKAMADNVLYKGISTSTEVYKIRPATKMIEILISYSSYCEKSNRYQIISTLCDCFKWLDDIPTEYSPSVPIYNYQKEREKLYAGAIGTHNFQRIQTLQRDNNNDNDDKFKQNLSSKSGLPIPSAIIINNINNDAKEDNEKLEELFIFANKCLQCISVYVSYHDISSTLSRAILPRLNKARSFQYKKYLLHAAMETTLLRKHHNNNKHHNISKVRRSPLTSTILRYILQCPFVLSSENILHKNELIDLTQLLFHNLSLKPSINYNRNNIYGYMCYVKEFEKDIKRNIINQSKPNLSNLNDREKKWIYSIIYKDLICEQEPKPLYILKSYSITINIIFHSFNSYNDLENDLKYIFPFLISIQNYANNLNKSPNQISYSCLIHTWILSLLFLLIRCFKSKSKYTQQLISILKNVKNQRSQSHQIWSNFLIDEFGLIQTSSDIKDKLIMQKSLKDESIRVPYEAIFGSNNAYDDDDDIPSLNNSVLSSSKKKASNVNILQTTNEEKEEFYILDDDDDGSGSDSDLKDTDNNDLLSGLGDKPPSAPMHRQKSASLPASAFKNIKNRKVNKSQIDVVTHLIPFDKLLPIIAKALNIDVNKQSEWIATSKGMYDYLPDYQDLFKANKPGLNNSPSTHSDTQTDAPSITMEFPNFDQTSVPSEIYWGRDIFQTPTAGKGHSLKNIFEDDQHLKNQLRRNILIQKKLIKMDKFQEIINVYDAQTDHIDNANETYFHNLESKLRAQKNVNKYNLLTVWDKDKDKDRDKRIKFDDDYNYDHSHIVGIDEDAENDNFNIDKNNQYDPYHNNQYINKASFKTLTPSLFKISYSTENDLTNTSSLQLQSRQSGSRGDDIAYLLIEQNLLNNPHINNNDNNNNIQDLLRTTMIDDNNNNYRGQQILNEDFSYRLGLKEFDFEEKNSNIQNVEYELDGLNIHYIDPNDIMDTQYNILHHHHHIYGHGINNDNYINYNYHHKRDDYESDISSASDNDDNDNNDYKYNKKRHHHRNHHHHHKKRKKLKLPKSKVNKQIEKTIKTFGKNIRSKIEEMKQKRENTHNTHNIHHGNNNSNEFGSNHNRKKSYPNVNIDGGNIQLTLTQTTKKDNRDKSPQPIANMINSNIYAGSLTDTDEPNDNIKLSLKQNNSFTAGHIHPTKTNKKQKLKAVQSIPSQSNTKSNNTNDNKHSRRGSSSNSISGSTSINYVTNYKHNTNNPIQEEDDDQYYQSDD